MGGNLFTHAMSEAKVQAHEVCLKLKAVIKRMGGNLFTHAMSEAEVQAHEVCLNVKTDFRQ